MATDYPGDIDDFDNPEATDNLDGSIGGSTVYHDEQHANINDAVEALEAKVGIDSSAVTTSHDYRITRLKLDIQTFTSSGTWTKPVGALITKAITISAGGGGGSGARKVSGGAPLGGGAGASGVWNEEYFLSSALSATETVTIGAAGTGGAVQTVDDSAAGNAGTAGGNTSFGSWLVSVGGNPGVNQNGGAINNAALRKLGQGAGSSGTNASGVAAATKPNIGPGGGAGGAGLSGADAPSAGAEGAAAFGIGGTTTTGGGGAAGTGGGAGSAGASSATTAGAGGGSGHGSATGAAGAGGAGGAPGGGGGGGGASLNGNNSGAGGDGGRGECRVITWCSY